MSGWAYGRSSVSCSAHSFNPCVGVDGPRPREPAMKSPHCHAASFPEIARLALEFLDHAVPARSDTTPLGRGDPPVTPSHRADGDLNPHLSRNAVVVAQVPRSPTTPITAGGSSASAPWQRSLASLRELPW